jgi:hypothetical protein
LTEVRPEDNRLRSAASLRTHGVKRQSRRCVGLLGVASKLELFSEQTIVAASFDDGRRDERKQRREAIRHSFVFRSRSYIRDI